MSTRPLRQQAGVLMGTKASAVGELTFVREGRREYSGFSYASAWLRSRDRFEISPDLPLREGSWRDAFDELLAGQSCAAPSAPMPAAARRVSRLNRNSVASSNVIGTSEK